MRASRILVASILLLIASVGVAAEPPTNSSKVLYAMRAAGVKIAATKCRGPAQEYSKTVINRHSDESDIETTTVCDGREVTVYKVTSDPNVSFVTALVLNQKQIGIPFGLNIGSKQKAVERVLGTPSEGSSNILLYHVYYPTGDDEIRIHVQDGIVRKMEWQWNYD